MERFYPLFADWVHSVHQNRYVLLTFCEKFFWNNKVLNCSSGHVQSSFNNCAQRKDRRLHLCTWRSENDEKSLGFFKKKYFSSNWSSGHVECSFKNPSQKSLPNSWINYTQCPKLIRRNLVFAKNNKVFSQNCFFGDVERKSDKRAEKTFDKKPKNFRSMSETLKNWWFFQKKKYLKML